MSENALRAPLIRCIFAWEKVQLIATRAACITFRQAQANAIFMLMPFQRNKTSGNKFVNRKYMMTNARDKRKQTENEAKKINRKGRTGATEGTDEEPAINFRL